jgi:hypothetical protein
LLTPERSNDNYFGIMSTQRLGVLVALASAFFVIYTFHASGEHKLGDTVQLLSDYAFKRNRLASTGEQKGLTVIGAGFPRTGTKSIEKALQKLGHRVYDMRGMLLHGHTERWVQAAEDWKFRGDLYEVESLLKEIEAEGYTSTLDLPMNLFALAFADLRPNAKVLFSVRDNEETWLKSFQAISYLVGPLFSCRPWKWIFPSPGSPGKLLKTLRDFDMADIVYPTHLSRPVPWFETIHTHPTESPERMQALIEMHKKFQRELEANLPPNRLLVYNVKQGWAPLIPFLGLQNETLVKEEFPITNDRASWKLIRKAMDLIAIGAPVWILMILWILTRVLHACIRLKMAFDDRMKTKIE